MNGQNNSEDLIQLCQTVQHIIVNSYWVHCDPVTMPEHGLANRIITEAQEVSPTKVMNENDIGQVYFSHPHKDGGIKQ